MKYIFYVTLSKYVGDKTFHCASTLPAHLSSAGSSKKEAINNLLTCFNSLLEKLNTLNISFDDWFRQEANALTDSEWRRYGQQIVFGCEDYITISNGIAATFIIETDIKEYKYICNGMS